jgi:hypothetical protein
MNTFARQVFLLVLALGVIPVRSASFQTNSIEGWTTLVLSNPMEYFAEATEAFFSRNDFFPFTREERALLALVEHAPEEATRAFRELQQQSDEPIRVEEIKIQLLQAEDSR